MNVLELEGSRTRLLENSIATCLYMCILLLVCSLCLLLLVYLERVRRICKCVCLRLSHADVVGGLLGSCSMHLPVLVYLCNKLVIVVTIAFVYCFPVNVISSYRVTLF